MTIDALVVIATLIRIIMVIVLFKVFEYATGKC